MKWVLLPALATLIAGGLPHAAACTTDADCVAGQQCYAAETAHATCIMGGSLGVAPDPDHCQQCASQFASDGGCDLMNANQTYSIPSGCDDCNMELAMHCMMGPGSPMHCMMEAMVPMCSKCPVTNPFIAQMCTTGVDPCAEVCPVGECDSEADAGKTVCAPCLACRMGNTRRRLEDNFNMQAMAELCPAPGESDECIKSLHEYMTNIVTCMPDGAEVIMGQAHVLSFMCAKNADGASCMEMLASFGESEPTCEGVTALNPGCCLAMAPPEFLANCSIEAPTEVCEGALAPIGPGPSPGRDNYPTFQPWNGYPTWSGMDNYPTFQPGNGYPTWSSSSSSSSSSTTTTTTTTTEPSTEAPTEPSTAPPTAPPTEADAAEEPNIVASGAATLAAGTVSLALLALC